MDFHHYQQHLLPLLLCNLLRMYSIQVIHIVNFAKWTIQCKLTFPFKVCWKKSHKIGSKTCICVTLSLNLKNCNHSGLKAYDDNTVGDLNIKLSNIIKCTVFTLGSMWPWACHVQSTSVKCPHEIAPRMN